MATKRPAKAGKIKKRQAVESKLSAESSRNDVSEDAETVDSDPLPTEKTVSPEADVDNAESHEDEREADQNASQSEDDDNDDGDEKDMSNVPPSRRLFKKRKIATSSASSEAKSATDFSAPKRRVLILSSRGIVYRYRHLMTDLIKILPHSKKDAKLDSKDQLYVINEISDLKNCNVCMFFEVRRHTDLYLYITNPPHGPTVKFQVFNVHTMEELKLTGNCLMGSRAILVFDSAFESQPHTQLIKGLFTQVFSVPKGHKKGKPFVDHCIMISIVDHKYWFRHYQVCEPDLKVKNSEPSLVEIGPRFVLDPIVILGGSFGGPVLWENPKYKTPTALRRLARQQKANVFVERKRSTQKRKEYERGLSMPEDGLEDVFAE